MNGGAWAGAALALYLLGLVLAFGVRTWLQLRRTGSSGFRGISGRPGSLAWWGGVLFPAAVLLGLAAPALVLVGATPRSGPLAHPLPAAAGLVLAIAGLAVVVVAQEPYLRRVHGDSYRRYAATAGRFLPGIGTG